MAGESLHEERSILGAEILDRHRAISTLMEELEAIDWYDQRIQASENAQLRAVLLHNRNDETEHASMLLEWVRRHDPAFNQQMTKFLFTKGPIENVGAASAASPTAGATGPATNSLGIGSLRATICVPSGGMPPEAA
jgi:ferritin-like protein